MKAWYRQLNKLFTLQFHSLHSGVSEPSEDAITKAINKDEMARHCKRTTRPVDEMHHLIDSTIAAMSKMVDPQGVLLLSDSMGDIWAEQQRHLDCVQDVPGISLYTVTSHLKKGGVTLPVYRCARGSTSLESFHYHLARFIPGTSASDVNFQAYLLDGVSRWNAMRAQAAYSSSSNKYRTFDVKLQDRVHCLSENVFGASILPLHRLPVESTTELFGMEFLNSQSNFGVEESFTSDAVDVSDIDEGFQDGWLLGDTTLDINTLIGDELPVSEVSRRSR